MATPSLIGLPAELIVPIIDYLRPTDHLNFALTCKRLHQLSDKILQHHKNCYEKYSVSSDLHPLVVPELLEKILFDPIVAHHVRDLEYWGLRRVWDQWYIAKPGVDFAVRLADEGSPEILLDRDDPGKSGYVFTEDGRSQVERRLNNDLGLDEQTANDLADRITLGAEESLKLLIMGISPRLRSIKFPNLSINDINQRTSSGHPLTELSRAIVRLTHPRLPGHPWPPGFASLRSVSVGVKTHRGRGFILPFPFVAPLFLLPNLEYLFLDHPHSGYDTHQARDKLRRRISTVQHLHISSGDLELEEASEMIHGIAKLKSFSLQSLHRNGCDVIRLLSIHHGETLEYMDMCDTDTLQLLHERHFSILSVGGMKMFANLRYIAVDLLVLLHQHIETRYAHPGQFVTHKRHADISTIYLASILPHSIEKIAFKLSSHNYLLSSRVADAVSDLVAEAIRNKTLPNLKAVFFEDLTPQKPSSNQPLPYKPTDMAWFRGAVAAGRENGVEVCTVWTHPGRRMRERKDELGIPRAVSGGDMKTDTRNSRRSLD